MPTLAIEIMRDLEKTRRGGGYYKGYGDRSMPEEDAYGYESDEPPIMSGDEKRMIAKEFLKAVERGDSMALLDAFKALMYACE